jgi:muramoyltetrapeptide carboxypeptidase LdcA involved in peptidoglycan recycling
VNPQQIETAFSVLSHRFDVSFAQGVYEQRQRDGPSLKARIDDIDDAILDETVDIVMSAIGGYSSAELIPFLDYDKISRSQKIFCGFSDVSVLLNTITVRSQIQTLLGPHFSTFGHLGFASTIEGRFLQALDATEPYELLPVKEWGNERWYEQPNWTLQRNLGPRVLREGWAKGISFGGNISSIVGNFISDNLRPEIIIFLETHSGYQYYDLLKWIGAIVRGISKFKICAILIGKLPYDISWLPAYDRELLEVTQDYCSGPVVVDLDFGHNMPIFTVPLGATIELSAMSDGVRLRVMR